MREFSNQSESRLRDSALLGQKVVRKELDIEGSKETRPQSPQPTVIARLALRKQEGARHREHL